MFFGRQDVFEFIRRTLIGKHRDNVIVLYGQRRTGKTSILYQMRSHLDTHYLCIFTDIHGFALEGLGGFLWELANHIARVLRREYKIDLPPPNRSEFMADPRSEFENEFLNRVWSTCRDRHLLLMLDESIRLYEQVQAGKLEPEIFEYMRHLMQHYERLNFLFSLGSGLEEMEKEYSFLFSVGLYKRISFLDRNAASALITQPVKDYYQTAPAALDLIIQITSGHPYYTQLLCHSLFNRWQQQHISQIEVRDVEEVLDEVVERGSAVLKHIWEESTAGDKAIMAGMSATMGSSNHPVEANDINSTWTLCDVVIPKGEMANATRSLIAREVIADQDKYVFTVDLQRLWTKKHRRLEWVKEEIADALREWASERLQQENVPSLHPARNKLKIMRIVLIAIVVLAITLSIIAIYSNKSTNIDHTNATSTALAQSHRSATATVLAIKSATSISQTATAGPRVNPTATFYAKNPDPYPPYTGRFTFSDPLSKNDNNRWNEITGYPNSCSFEGGAYHVSEIGPPSAADIAVCSADGPLFYNFAFEVQMRIIMGDCGGLDFRDRAPYAYRFIICQDGSYTLTLWTEGLPPGFVSKSETLRSGTTSVTNKGLNALNVVAVVANGSHVDLYVNEKRIDGISDAIQNLNSGGKIGFIAEYKSNRTEVVYRNTKVWEL